MVPYCPKYSRSLSADVCQLRPPTKSLLCGWSPPLGVERPDELEPSIAGAFSLPALDPVEAAAAAAAAAAAVAAAAAAAAATALRPPETTPLSIPADLWPLANLFWFSIFSFEFFFFLLDSLSFFFFKLDFLGFFFFVFKFLTEI